MSKSPQERRERVQEHGAYWVPVNTERIWTNHLWEVFGTYTLVDVNGEPALKATPGHDRAPGVLALIAAAFGLAAMFCWPLVGVYNPFDPSTPVLGYVPWACFGGTVVFGVLTAWNVATLTAGLPSTALVLLTSPKIVAFAKHECHPKSGKLSNADGRSIIEAQMRPKIPKR